jgi:hypothetical protein
LTFLKCGFRRDDAIDKRCWLPTMDVNTIYELTNWVSVGLPAEEACLVNVDTALRMAFFHGRSFFNVFRDDCMRALSRKLLVSSFSLISWEKCLNDWRAEQFQVFPQTSPATGAPLVLDF